MKVIYIKDSLDKGFELYKNEKDILILLRDNWDDHTFKTTFSTFCNIKGEKIPLDYLKILVENQKTSADYLDSQIKKGWDGLFPIPNANYISTPFSLDFYEQIKKHSEFDVMLSIATILHDASYMSRIEADTVALKLICTEGFLRSLQRERGAERAFIDGWKLFQKMDTSIENQEFIFKYSTEASVTLSLKFNSEVPLPHDINLLIGSNGGGKSRLLLQLVKNWLSFNPDNNHSTGFKDRPNLSQLVVVSYSPFDRFPVDTEEEKEIQDKNFYKYFGLRGREHILSYHNNENLSGIVLSETFSAINAAQSLLNCLANDLKYVGIDDWSKKRETMETVLRSAIDFDYVAVVAKESCLEDDELFFDEGSPSLKEEFLKQRSQEEKETKRIFIPISSNFFGYLNVELLRKYIDDKLGIFFLKNGSPMLVSSGQRLFFYMIVNILGAVRRNSLILIDEPEVFLHPNLEIEFVRMLKSVLSIYSSKAIIATHSAIIAREVPRECVHVFKATTDGLIINNPPFETFGGDIQRIISYVFGDNQVLSKPYEEWIREKLKKLSAKELIAALGTNINEEMIIQIHAMENNQW